MTHTHEFDFWIGDWDVFGPKGQQVGTNSITALFGDAADTGMLHEHWHGNGGVVGRSINGYDAARGVWHQTWMDSGGGVLQLDGGLQDGAMVMKGSAPSDDDPTRIDTQRITWTQLVDDPDGAEVRQVWESSTDGGATWTLAFDGRYRRRVSTGE